MKPCTLKNLRQVTTIVYDPEASTIFMRTIPSTKKDNMINMSSSQNRGDEDDKAGGFSVGSVSFLLLVMGEITGKKFEATKRTTTGLRVYQTK